MVGKSFVCNSHCFIESDLYLCNECMLIFNVVLRLIRKGNIPEQLRLLVSEVGAEMIILGRPVRSMGRSVFTPDKFDRFVESLEKDTGIHIVQIIHDE